MQTLRAGVGVRCAAPDVRLHLQRLLQGDRTLRLLVNLDDLKLPEGLTLEVALEVQASLAVGSEQSDECLQITFKTNARNLVAELEGCLEVYPAAYGSETIIEITAAYETPPGMLGFAIDTTVGYVIAQRAVTDLLARMVQEIQSRAPAS